MKRRDFTIGLLLAATVRTVRAQERAKQHRIAIVIPAGPVATIGEEDRLWRTFFEELHRLGDVEAENLAVERYSAEGRPEAYPDLAREVVSRDPDVIVAAGNAFARAARAATGTIPIVWIGGSLIRAGLVPSLARRGATSPALPVMRGSRFLGSACRFSRKPSLRHPGLHICGSNKGGKVPTGSRLQVLTRSSFGRQAGDWKLR